MSLTTIISSIKTLEDLYYNVDLSIYQCPDIKNFVIEFPKIINDIHKQLELLQTSAKPSDVDFINVKQLQSIQN